MRNLAMNTSEKTLLLKKKSAASWRNKLGKSWIFEQFLSSKQDF